MRAAAKCTARGNALLWAPVSVGSAKGYVRVDHSRSGGNDFHSRPEWSAHAAQHANARRVCIRLLLRLRSCWLSCRQIGTRTSHSAP